MIADVETTIATLRDAARALRSVTVPTTHEIRALNTAKNAIDAALADRLAEIDEAKAHEAEGASSISTWARRELRQDAGTTRQMVAAAKTFRDLPSVAEAARKGAIGFEHAVSFTYSLKHVGADETRQLEQTLLGWAESFGPQELHARIRDVRDRLHSDELDEKWRKGMDKRDLSLSKTLDGWHLTGFLDIETGAMLKTIVSSLSVPRDAGDDRTASQRRMDALNEICTGVLEHGLPADNGVRPHVTVTVDTETLKRTLRPEPGQVLELELKPATLEGFGHIGPQLLRHLLCGAEVTPILIERVGSNTRVLDVGDTKRFATEKQSKAIVFRQRRICASPGCKHPIAHVHHVVWVSRGGTTDLDHLVGLCRKCHTLVHSEQLEITGTHATGFRFTTRRGSPLHRRAG